MEPLSNIGFVCDKHRSRPGPVYATKPFEFFIGKFCKLAFPTGLKKPKPQTEAMWVKVIAAEQHDGKTMLCGLLNNDPVYVTEYTDGCWVAFDRDEVCAVMD